MSRTNLLPLFDALPGKADQPKKPGEFPAFLLRSRGEFPDTLTMDGYRNDTVVATFTDGQTGKKQFKRFNGNKIKAVCDTIDKWWGLIDPPQSRILHTVLGGEKISSEAHQEIWQMFHWSFEERQ